MYNTEKEFIADVVKEIEHLKVHATKEELSRLSFDNLEPTSTTLCIYGQMTGNCFSDRSLDLYDRCLIQIPYNDDTFEKFKSKLLGSKDYGTYSPLEAYIPLRGAKNKHIISYLRGEDETLKL